MSEKSYIIYDRTPHLLIPLTTLLSVVAGMSNLSQETTVELLPQLPLPRQRYPRLPPTNNPSRCPVLQATITGPHR